MQLRDDDEGGDSGDSNSISDSDSEDDGDCDLCSHDVCSSELNKCPLWDAPFLCVEGRSVGGCSPVPWEVRVGEERKTKRCKYPGDSLRSPANTPLTSQVAEDGFCKSCCRLVADC